MILQGNKTLVPGPPHPLSIVASELINELRGNSRFPALQISMRKIKRPPEDPGRGVHVGGNSWVGLCRVAPPLF